MSAILIIGILFLSVIMLVSWTLIRSNSDDANLKRFRKELKPGDKVQAYGSTYEVINRFDSFNHLALRNIETKQIISYHISEIYPIEK